MSNGLGHDESLFRIALSTRQETDPLFFSNYFYDTAQVYVYAPQPASHLEYVSNIVHEVGHSLLADTPLGFLHLSLFELAACAADLLWSQCVFPQLRRRFRPEVPAHQQLADLRHLESVGPRDVDARARSRHMASDLLALSGAEILKAITSDAEMLTLAVELKNLQRRRVLLIQSADLCHEALATFVQLRECDDVATWYAQVLRARSGELGALGAIDDIRAWVGERRRALTSRWREGYELASSLASATASPWAVVWASRLAHHFVYSNYALIDSSFEQFELFAKSLSLSANERFRWTVQRVKASPTVWSSPTAGTELLGELASEASTAHRGQSFFHWHRENVFGCRLGKLLQKGGALVPRTESSLVGNDRWDVDLMPEPAFRPRPLIRFDGTVLAASLNEASMVRAEFVRAYRLRAIDRVLSHLDVASRLN